MPNVVDQRIASRIHQQQVALVERAEALAVAVGRVYERLVAALVAIGAEGGNHSDVVTRARKAAQHAHVEAAALMGERMGEMVQWSHRATADLFAKTVPPSWWMPWGMAQAAHHVKHPMARHTRYWKSRLHETRDPDHGVVIVSPLKISDELEPVRHGPRGWPRTPEQARAFVRENVMPPLTSTEARAVLTSPGYGGITWEQRFARYAAPDRDHIANELTQGISSGEGVVDLRKRMEQIVAGPRYKAQLIARTESCRVASTASSQAVERGLGDMILGKQYIATMDQFTRPDHAARNGKMYYRQGEDSYVAKDGEVFPGDHWTFNCLLPGQLVSGRFSGALRAVYSGKVVQCRTESERTLACTANHRVLTKRGWVAASELQHGDELLCDARIVPRDGSMVSVLELPDGENDEPTAVEQVFETFGLTNGAPCPWGGAVDFHGDERFLEGNVEVVGASRKLLLNVNPELQQGTGDPGCNRRDVLLASEPSCSPGGLPVFGIDGPATGIPRTGELPLHPAGIGLDLLPLQRLSIGPTADLHARFFEAFGQVAATDPEAVSQLLHGFPGLVTLDRVVEVQRFNWTGHVYDLQTEVGWYSGNGIIIHNCRCYGSTVLQPPEEFASAPALRAEFMNAQANDIPDPSSYSDWFEGASEGARKTAVGVRRYNAVADKFDAAPAWVDFIDENGRLLSPDKLKRENPAQRAKRKAAVEAMIAERARLFNQATAMGFLPEEPA